MVPMPPVDIAQWTLNDWITRVPVSALWSAFAFVAGAFGVGFGFSAWLEKRKRDHLGEQIERLRAEPKVTISIGSTEHSLGSIAGVFRFSFEKPEFIHPEIVEELEGWISDPLPVFAAVDLEGAMKSNRFVRKVETKESTEGKKVWVYAVKHDAIKTLTWPYYGYKYIGTTPTGTHIVQTANSGGGSGVFGGLLFLQFQGDGVVDEDLSGTHSRQRVLLKCIGRHGLGDRYDGVVTYADGALIIGSGNRIDNGWTPVEETKIRVE
jgi:hypothetical protein